MIEPAPLTMSQLAERWDCSRRTIERMMADGRLRGFRLGGKLIRFPVSEVVRCEQDLHTADTPSAGEPTAMSSPGVTRAVNAAVIGSARR